MVRPVIYRNGEKLDEPYVNDFPLVYVLPENEHALREQITEELLGKTLPLRIIAKTKLTNLSSHW